MDLIFLCFFMFRKIFISPCIYFNVFSSFFYNVEVEKNGWIDCWHTKKMNEIYNEIFHTEPTKRNYSQYLFPDGCHTLILDLYSWETPFLLLLILLPFFIALFINFLSLEFFFFCFSCDTQSHIDLFLVNLSFIVL